MIEIVTPAMLTLVVDQGRYGHSAVGIPPSAALDGFACAALNRLTGHEDSAPVLEVVGSRLVLRFNIGTACAITGAKVKAFLDDREILPWTTFLATRGSTLRVKDVLEGFRYYVGFSGAMILDKIMGSYTTNLECGFGGYKGRALAAGDSIEIRENGFMEMRTIPEEFIPRMAPPHTLRIIKGPEAHYFSPASIATWADKTFQPFYSVSNTSNRTGIRLTGEPLRFRNDVEKSIISEGVMPGTIQIPGDGQPIIMLYERTIGGYARAAMVIRADLDRLAHLKPANGVTLEMISLEEADRLWEDKMERLSRLDAI